MTEQTEEQQPGVRAQPIFTDAETRGKTLVITEAADVGPALRPEEEPEEDEVEEVLGHPQDKRQHVYERPMGCSRGNPRGQRDQES